MFRKLMPCVVLAMLILGLPLFAHAAAKAEKADTAAPAKVAKPAPAAETTPAPGPAPSNKGFCFKDTAGEYLDVYLDGRAVARYMYANDVSTPARAHSTFKPFLHVFDAEGKAPITKGPGGDFTHHRGIFIGWQKVGFEGGKYNLWEMGKNRQVHQKFLDQKAGPDQASFTSLVSWNLDGGKTILEDERTFTFSRRPAPALAFIDFVSKVKALGGDLDLNGDPEHGGIQFRPANELTRTATKYCFPKDAVNAAQDASADWNPPFLEKDGKKSAIAKIEATDLPWAAESFTLSGKTYFVEDMSSPDNPKGSRWSAYRDYGRFGAFPHVELKKGDVLTVRYRFWVSTGTAPTRADFQKQYEEFSKAAAK